MPKPTALFLGVIGFLFIAIGLSATTPLVVGDFTTPSACDAGICTENIWT